MDDLRDPTLRDPVRDPYGRDLRSDQIGYPAEAPRSSSYIAAGIGILAVIVLGLVLFTGGRDPTPSTATAPATEAPAPATPAPGTPRAPQPGGTPGTPGR
jgi:hypothetical protein